jgi:hypothetical protein
LEEKNINPQELDDRLIDFAVMVIGVVEALPNSKSGSHIAGQWYAPALHRHLITARLATRNREKTSFTR